MRSTSVSPRFRSDAPLVALAAAGVLLAAASCATYEAVVSAPPSFWLTLEVILLALWQDVSGLVDLLL